MDRTTFEALLKKQIREASVAYNIPINSQTQIAAVIGHPLSTTHSPLIHNTTINHLNMVAVDIFNAIYIRLPIPPESFKACIPYLKEKLIGFNVTVPYKEAMIPFLDSISDDAANIGAVNTVKIIEGQLLGFNTDADGFMWSLTKENNYIPEGKVVAMFGAGGAARAITCALLKEKIQRLVLINRTKRRAEKLKLDMYKYFNAIIEILELDNPQVSYYLNYSDLIINASSAGMSPNDAPLYKSMEWIKEGKHTFYDVIYQRPTDFLWKAKEMNAKAIDGAGMLYGQGVVAFNIIFDRQPHHDIMRKALREKQQEAHAALRKQQEKDTDSNDKSS